jgi:hypothetical protein
MLSINHLWGRPVLTILRTGQLLQVAERPNIIFIVCDLNLCDRPERAPRLLFDQPTTTNLH